MGDATGEFGIRIAAGSWSAIIRNRQLGISIIAAVIAAGTSMRSVAIGAIAMMINPAATVET